MGTFDLKRVTEYVEEHIGEFHQSRLDKVTSIKLKDVLRSKNPYLFRAKNVNKSNEIIEGILDAFISSSEEGIFGNWLERLAVFINKMVYVGQKAAVDGIDLDFEKDGKRYLIAIKSGPAWGNDSQIKKLVDQFNTARKRLATSGNTVETVCVNGCCYGRSREASEYKAKGNYFKMCGARFWELISGEPNLYLDLVEPLGNEAAEKNEEFQIAYAALVNRLNQEFLNDFCDDGFINWDKLIRFNSSY